MPEQHVFGSHFLVSHFADPYSRNKWVLNTTETPLFFLLSQLIIAVILFLIAHTLGFLQLPLQLDMQVCKGLIPMVGLSVIGLRYGASFLAHGHFLNALRRPFPLRKQL